MKRYIRQSVDYNRLAFEVEGRTQYLPTWCIDLTDEELDALKQNIIEDYRRPKVHHIADDINVDVLKLRRDLKKEGFSNTSIDEIVMRVQNGDTIDSAIQRQIMRDHIDEMIVNNHEQTSTASVHASMDVEELENAVLNGRPFELDEFQEYWDTYHQPEEGAITADEVNEHDIIENTEDASEINIGDVFHVDSIKMHAPDWEEFDYEFDVTLLNGDYKGDHVKLHYMADEYVGVRSDVGRALGIYNSTDIKASKKTNISDDLRSILEDVMIDTLDDYSGKHILIEFIENVRYLQDWDEYAEEHADEMIELKKLSDNQLTDIGAEILDEVNHGWDSEVE